jgi:hypothetical protein
VRRVPFSCFALSDSFSAVPRASGPVFKFCAPGLIFGGTEGVGTRFHVLRARRRSQRYRGRRVPFSYFALSVSFSAVPRASGTIFMFYAPGLNFDGTEGVGSHFHVLRVWTSIPGYRWRRVSFSCFALPPSFLAVPWVPGPVFIFLRSQRCFPRYRGHRVPFSCFAHPEAFLAVPRASGPVFMFCAPGPVFGGAKCVGSRFHVLTARTHFRRSRGFSVPFLCFARPYSFSVVQRAYGSDFMFCALGHVFGDAVCVRSRFDVLCARTRLRRRRGRRVLFSLFACRG